MKSTRLALTVAMLFGVLLTGAVHLDRLPPAVLWMYAGASVLAALLLGFDKRAAIAGRRRIAERTLQASALCCGWPGALVAMAVLRHKTAKYGFQQVFWCAVLLNCSVLAWIAVG